MREPAQPPVTAVRPLLQWPLLMLAGLESLFDKQKEQNRAALRKQREQRMAKRTAKMPEEQIDALDGPDMKPEMQALTQQRLQTCSDIQKLERLIGKCKLQLPFPLILIGSMLYT